MSPQAFASPQWVGIRFLLEYLYAQIPFISIITNPLKIKMKRVICIAVVVILLSMAITPVSAVAPDTLVRQILEEDGLIDNSVTSLVRDSDNDLLYIGTPSGISVYDTNQEVFVFNRTYSNISTNVLDICNAYGGGGAYILSSNQSYPVREYWGTPDSDDYLNISFPDSPALRCISHAQDNLLYVGSNGYGVFEYVINAIALTQYNVSHDLLSTDNNQVSELITGKVVGSTDWLFVGTSNGVWVFDIEAKTFLDFGTLETIGYSVQALYFDNVSDELYIGTPEGLHIYAVTETGATWGATVSKAHEHGELENENILSLGLDGSSRQLYIGTAYNLVKYDLSESVGVLMSSFQAELGFSQLADQTINAIAVDDTEDMVYVGMQHSGIGVFIIAYGAGAIELSLEVIAFIGVGGLVAIVVCLYTRGQSS